MPDMVEMVKVSDYILISHNSSVLTSYVSYIQ